jgi:hypothetical protein
MKPVTIRWTAVALAAVVTALAVLAFSPALKVPASKESGRNSGLYLTPDDFRHNKLSYAIAPSGGQTRIKIHDGLFGSTTVDLIYEGRKQVFSMDRVYGYRDAKGQDYRFFDRSAYCIADTGGFYLYTNARLVQGEKIARPQTLYFFSVTPATGIQPLTLANLDKAFAGNTRFRYSVETLQGQFGSDAALAAYDGVLNNYKIKFLYAQSLQ